jgi:hypothetical protein
MATDNVTAPSTKGPQAPAGRRRRGLLSMCEATVEAKRTKRNRAKAMQRKVCYEKKEYHIDIQIFCVAVTTVRSGNLSSVGSGRHGNQTDRSALQPSR